MTSIKDKRQFLAKRYTTVRNQTMQFSDHLEPEDHVVQTAWFVSPAKWHLAHTTWFFEVFVLMPYWPEFERWNDTWDVLFNSYYNTVGEQFPQSRRGLLTRPTVLEIKQYRHFVDQAMLACIYQIDEAQFDLIQTLVTLGLHHEQQHQELFLTDIKHVFAANPLHPVFAPRSEAFVDRPQTSSTLWHRIEEGIYDIGVQRDAPFFFDNEGPRHRAYLQNTQIAQQLVTNGQFVEFIEDGGYQTVGLWLSDGWHCAQNERWQSPMYWSKVDGQWHHMTLHGFEPVDVNAPVCHVSYYEADAFATWAGMRLPTEFEWEVATTQLCGQEIDGHFMESGVYQPIVADSWFGSVWQWTSSPYIAYPGYRPLDGALGEYNGKFMCNTIVLRGGSCASPQSHLRATYRNFFSPHTRWQFSGIRLAKDGD